MFRSISAFLLALTASLWTLPTVQAEPTLHLLLLGDVGDPNLSDAIDNNQGRVYEAFSGLIPHSRLQVVRWGFMGPSETVTASGTRLKQTLNDLAQGRPEATPPVRRYQTGDSVFVYYIGHGEYHVQDREHVLKYSSGPIKRSEVESLMRQTFPAAQMMMLITDTCATAVSPKKAYMAKSLEVDQTPAGIHRLFFAAKGFANINSCDWGQIALGNYQILNPEPGESEISRHAPFTEMLCRTLEQNKNSSTLTWQKLYDDVKRETAALFKQTYPSGRQVLSLSGERVYQTTQDPIAVSELPRAPGETTPPDDTTPPPDDTTPPPPPPPGAGRLGVAVQELPGPGVKIARIEQNSPARTCIDSQGRMGQMETGDVILKVNGQPIDTVDDLADAIRKSPREASFELKNVRDGSIITVRTQLRK